MGRDVDIVDLRKPSLDAIQLLLREGRQLLARKDAGTLAWETQRMTAYALFNPRRIDIVEQYMRESLRRAP